MKKFLFLTLSSISVFASDALTSIEFSEVKVPMIDDEKRGIGA